MPSKPTGAGRGGGPAFTATEREGVLAEVARLDRAGHTQADIARRVGVSQPQVCGYLRTTRDRYRAATLEDRAARVEREAAFLMDVRAEAMAAYEASKAADGGPRNEFLRTAAETVRQVASLYGVGDPPRGGPAGRAADDPAVVNALVAIFAGHPPPDPVARAVERAAVAAGAEAVRPERTGG